MKDKQLIWVDFIRAISCFMVVFLHSAAPILDKYKELPFNYWFIGNIYDSLVRVCVPLFFMISGFLLLQKEETLPLYFYKRFSKLFVPIIFWSLFFVLWKSFIENNSSPSLWHFYSVILAPSYYHLWFLYALVGLYLFVPILRKITNSTDDNILIYYCLIWFLAVSIIPFMEKVSHIDSKIDLNSISGFIGYFVLGFILGRKNVSTKVFVMSSAFYLSLVSLTAIGTYYLTLKNGGVFSGYLYSYLAPNTILASGACFILIKHLAVKSKLLQSASIRKIITGISSCSFGIYLVHTVFLYLLKDGGLGFQLSAFSGNPLWYVPLTSLSVFTLSFFVIFIIKKIPFLKLIAP
ncbi:acyltransferase [Cycloclasticus pugetii]|uniref:acyltransferase n=1 Tax=Cycloclasticus pugetii TaxID=34068 RepID=UPI0039E55A34